MAWLGMVFVAGKNISLASVPSFETFLNQGTECASRINTKLADPSPESKRTEIALPP